MSTLSQFTGGTGRVTSLPVGLTGPFSGPSTTAQAAIYTNSGTTSGTGNLLTLLNVTGSKSRLNSLFFYAVDATSRDVRVRITLDGTVVFDSTRNVAGANQVMLAVGSPSGTGLAFQPVDALSSLRVEYACSLSESAKLTFGYNYELRA